MKEVLYYHIVLEPVDNGKLLKSIHQLVSKNYVANAYLSLYVCMLIDENFLTITILWYIIWYSSATTLHMLLSNLLALAKVTQTCS